MDRNVLLFWIVLEAQSFLIMYILWMFIYKDHSIVNGFTLSAMITYYFVSYFVRQNTNCYIHWNLIIKINDGTFAHFLYRPMSQRIYYIYHNIGEKMIRFLFLLPIAGIIFFLVKSYILLPSIGNLGYFLLATGVSFNLAVFFAFIVGYTSFWTENSGTLVYFKDSLIYYLSGAMIPLSFFGTKMSGILELLPFRYFVSFPIEIYLGKLDNAGMQKGFSIALIWTLIFIIAEKILSKYGLKRFSSVGN